MSEKSIINVKIRKLDGWYIATSNDLLGLMVAQQSIIKLTQEIPECIKIIYQAKFNAEVDVEELRSPQSSDLASVSFKEYCVSEKK